MASERFQGQKIGPFTVLSPTEDDYVHLVPQFRRTPDADESALKEANRLLWTSLERNLYELRASIGVLLEKTKKKLRKWIPEDWYTETLKEGGPW